MELNLATKSRVIHRPRPIRYRLRYRRVPQHPVFLPPGPPNNSVGYGKWPRIRLPQLAHSLSLQDHTITPRKPESAPCCDQSNQTGLRARSGPLSLFYGRLCLFSGRLSREVCPHSVSAHCWVVALHVRLSYGLAFIGGSGCRPRPVAP